MTDFLVQFQEISRTKNCLKLTIKNRFCFDLQHFIYNDNFKLSYFRFYSTDFQVPFLYPLKTFSFLPFSRDIEIEHGLEIGQTQQKIDTFFGIFLPAVVVIS